MPTINKGDPKNLEAEMKVLGCGYLSGTALEKICDELTVDMFYDKKNQIMFGALSSLYKKGEEIDSTILKNEIEKNTPLNQVGGVEYITEVIDSVLSASKVDSYITIIKDKALRRKLISACENIENIARNEEEESSNIIDDAEKEIFKITKLRKAGEFRTASEVIKTTRAQLEALSKRDSDVTGIPTGFYDFDRLTSGLQDNALIIIAARPAMGKTAFALNVAVNAAQASGKSVAIFNMEMSAEQLMTRMISAEGAIDGYKLKNGRLKNEDWKKANEAMSTLNDLPLYIEDDQSSTLGEIRAKCRRLAETSNLGLVVIDYLQLITTESRYGSNRQQEVSDISRGLKTMAMELGIPVVALAQLSRQVEGREEKRPMLSDLRESGSIEQDADIVAFLYRDDYYSKAQSEMASVSLSELIVAKHRNGANGTIKLVFERNYSNFRNYDNRKEEGE